MNKRSNLLIATIIILLLGGCATFEESYPNADITLKALNGRVLVDLVEFRKPVFRIGDRLAYEPIGSDQDFTLVSFSCYNLEPGVEYEFQDIVVKSGTEEYHPSAYRCLQGTKKFGMTKDFLYGQLAPGSDVLPITVSTNNPYYISLGYLHPKGTIIDSISFFGEETIVIGKIESRTVLF